MKPLDIAKTAQGSLCIITEVNDHRGENRFTAAVHFIGPYDRHEKVAWYTPEELIIIDSLPMVLARIAVSPGGSGMSLPADLFGRP